MSQIMQIVRLPPGGVRSYFSKIIQIRNIYVYNFFDLDFRFCLDTPSIYSRKVTSEKLFSPEKFRWSRVIVDG